MSTQQLTHEAIHTGLSIQGNDAKWFDMLNFRSVNGKTRAVPRKVELVSGTGFHTIIRGLDSRVYVLGSERSFILSASDQLEQFPLWQLSTRSLNEQSNLVNRTNTSQKLLVRGAYTGTTPVTIQLNLIKAPEVVEDVETPPTHLITCYNCDVENPTNWAITGIILDIETNLPIPSATADFVQYGNHTIVESNQAGYWETELPSGTYDLTITKTGYAEYSTSFTLDSPTDRIDYLTPVSNYERVYFDYLWTTPGDHYVIVQRVDPSPGGLTKLGQVITTYTESFYVDLPAQYAANEIGDSVILATGSTTGGGASETGSLDITYRGEVYSFDLSFGTPYTWPPTIGETEAQLHKALTIYKRQGVTFND